MIVVCIQVFCNARHVSDRLHIIKHLLDALHDLRIRYIQLVAYKIIFT